MYNTTLALTSNDLKKFTIIVDPDHFPKELHFDCLSGTDGIFHGSLENNTILWIDSRWETIENMIYKVHKSWKSPWSIIPEYFLDYIS